MLLDRLSQNESSLKKINFTMPHLKSQEALAAFLAIQAKTQYDSCRKWNGNMTMASADDRSWSTDALSNPLAPQVVLLKRTYILPWSQFLYAEGGNDGLRLTFAAHDVLVKGSNLNP